MLKLILVFNLVTFFQPKEWKFMRERTDKSLPNGLRTAENVVETMVNPVTETYLIE